ncbi:MAG: iron chelate uptake ABC transporter family permease subunit [Firmicutes bacterium]|nr:iron chelate uptake ABC transporter family permease subunit [Bacillota bacterium]
MKTKSITAPIIILTVLIIISVWACIHIGPEKLGFSEVNSLLMAGLKHEPMMETPIQTIVFELRLPRILLAALVGAALALSGTAFQGILRNPLADPYIVGTSAGAAVGGVIAIVFKLKSSFYGISGVAILAFVCALLAMFLIHKISSKGGKVPVETFLLAGVIVGSFLWALVSFLLTVATKEGLQEVIFWLMGSTREAGWSNVLMLLIYFSISFAGLMFVSYPLNLLTLGDESAQHLGVNVEKVKNTVIVFASLVTAASVAACGLIGFVGLMIPHVIRMIAGADHRKLIPLSALAGAVFMMWVDTAARTIISPQEIPVGILTAIMGAPFFLYLLRKRNS